MTGLRAAEAETNPFIWKECKESKVKKEKCTILQTRRGKVYVGRRRCVCLLVQNETSKIVSESVKTDTLISIPAFRMSAKIVAPTDQIICHCCCSLQRDTANCYYHSNPPHSLGGFHSSPITSSNDSNLSSRTCGLSKNGRDMWEKSDAIAAIRSRGISAPRGIREHANASHAGVGG